MFDYCCLLQILSTLMINYLNPFHDEVELDIRLDLSNQLIFSLLLYRNNQYQM